MFISAINNSISGVHSYKKSFNTNYSNALKTTSADSVSFTSKPKDMKKTVLILLGAPNSGKGTFAKAISKKFDLPQISTGDLLRSEIKNGTKLGKEAQSYMNAGGLVPDDLVIDIFKSRISKPDCKKGYILDGFPRTTTQAEKLEELLKKDKNTTVKVINLDVDEDILFDRSAKRYMCADCSQIYALDEYNPETSKCECGGALIKRADDTPEVLGTRLENYKKQSLPLLDFYADNTLNLEIHDNKTQSEILENILNEGF